MGTEDPEINAHTTVNWFLTTVPRPFNRERTVFTKNGCDTTEYPRVKNKTGP